MVIGRCPNLEHLNNKIVRYRLVEKTRHRGREDHPRSTPV